MTRQTLVFKIVCGAILVLLSIYSKHWLDVEGWAQHLVRRRDGLLDHPRRTLLLPVPVEWRQNRWASQLLAEPLLRVASFNKPVDGGGCNVNASRCVIRVKPQSLRNELLLLEFDSKFLSWTHSRQQWCHPETERKAHCIPSYARSSCWVIWNLTSSCLQAGTLWPCLTNGLTDMIEDFAGVVLKWSAGLVG